MANGTGFSIRSWSDVLSLLTLVGALSAAIAWGLKLDYGQSDHESRISALEAKAE